MANNSAMVLHEDLETFSHHLETFTMMVELDMMPKEAASAFYGQLTGMVRSINEFHTGNSVNDGMAKQASASLAQHAMDLAQKVDAGSPLTKASAQRFKEVLANARRTWLSFDALNRMTVI